MAFMLSAVIDQFLKLKFIQHEKHIAVNIFTYLSFID